jgi:2-dehydro-3-deoxygluconokinase
VDGQFYESPLKRELQVLDRIGSGDSFAAGIIYGCLTHKDPQTTLDFGVAHGALALTTPGDQSMANLDEVEKMIYQGGSSIIR